MSTQSTDPSRTISSSLRDQCLQRQKAVAHTLDVAGADALLVTAEQDIRYLTGFLGHDSLALLDGGGVVIISDPRYEEFLEPWRGTDVAKVVMGTRHRLHESVAVCCRERKIKRLGVQSEHMTIGQHQTLSDGLESVALTPTAGLVADQRMRKDALEIETIRRAIDVQQQAMQAAMQQLTQGMTEMQFCAVLEYEMKCRGATGPSFDTMVCSGPNSSVIHYQTSPVTIEPGVLLVDWGAVVDGYCSDMTRVFGVTHMPEKVAELYDIVLDAQQAAIDACAPGKTCADIDAVARKVITDSGYGDHFGHGLGHGLGMDIHESPYFNNLQTDVVLEPGMVMTVEPGIYLPGTGGVRIEDDIAITERGCEVLSNWPKHPGDLIVEWGSDPHDSRARATE